MEETGLTFKPDWPEAQKRWQAFWEMTNNDRPCLAVKVRQPGTLKPPASLAHHFFDPDYVTRKWLHELETTYFGGEAVPCGSVLLGGWALGCGPKVKWSDSTVWHPMLLGSLAETDKWAPGPDDPWREKMTRVVKSLLEEAPGKFVVGPTRQTPVNDLLALLRGTENFLVDLATDLDIAGDKLTELFPKWLADTDYFLKMTVPSQGYVSNWPGLWWDREYLITQSDMSCMISRDMFKQFVMREMDLLGERFECLWYHVDGPDAIRHVPELLTRPYIKAIQYVAGAGNASNGPDYLELYQQVQRAGRCLDLDVPYENIEFLIRRLRPEGLVLRTEASTREQADELLVNALNWCGAEIKSEVF